LLIKVKILWEYWLLTSYKIKNFDFRKRYVTFWRAFSGANLVAFGVDFRKFINRVLIKKNYILLLVRKNEARTFALLRKMIGCWLK